MPLQDRIWRPMIFICIYALVPGNGGAFNSFTQVHAPNITKYGPLSNTMALITSCTKYGLPSNTIALITSGSQQRL